MKIYNQADFDALERNDDGYIVCECGDWSDVDLSLIHICKAHALSVVLVLHPARSVLSALGGHFLSIIV